jgi:ferredoxin
MRCARSATSVTVAPGESILEAAEAGGIGIESLCRAGVCGTCRTRVLEGQVECASALLDDTDRQQGYVLACVSSLRSDCTIEA